MDEDNKPDQHWSEPVLADLAHALRRDGLVKTAEMLDDARILVAQEAAALQQVRDGQIKSGQAQLKLIAN